MLLGIFEFFNGEWFNNWFARTIGDLLAFLPKLLYFFSSCLLSIGDFFQVTFRKIAGLDPVVVTGEKVTGDSLYTIITNSIVGSGGNQFPALNVAFWSFIVLGLILLILFTIVAVIRIEYMPDKEKGNSKTNIMKNFFVGLCNIAIVPIIVLFGLFIGNQMIVVLDNVTSSISHSQADTYQYFDKWTSASVNPLLITETSDTYYSYEIFGENIPTVFEPFSGMVFKASAYSANRFRRHGVEYLNQVKNTGTSLGFLNDGSVNEPELAATIVDIGFGMNARLKNAPSDGYTLISTGIDSEYYSSGIINLFGSTSGIKNFSKYNVSLVWYFYDLWAFNFIIAFAAMIIIAKQYYTFCLMLMSRAFESFALFLFAPVAFSVTPLDSGSIGRWRKAFVGKYALLFCMIFGINIISPLLQIFQQFKFFNLAMLDYIVYTIFIIAGLSAANSISKSLMGVFIEKGGDVYEGALGSAEKIDKNLVNSVGVTAKAGALTGRLAVGAGRLAMSAASSGVEGGRRLHLRSEERKAMGNTKNITETDKEKARDMLKGMSKSERGELADSMFKTDRGRQFINTFTDTIDPSTGAITKTKEQKARESLLNNSYGIMTNAQQKELYTFMHERDLYNKTEKGSSSVEGSADWIKGFDRFETMSNRDRQTELMHREPINAQQRAVQQRRQDVIDHKPTNAFTKKLAGVGQHLSNAYAKGANKIRPIATKTARDLQSMLGTLLPHGTMFRSIYDRAYGGYDNRK